MPFPDSFTSTHLAFERLDEAHYHDLVAMHADPVQMAYLGGVRDAAATRAYLDRNLKHWAEHNFGLWMLRDRADGRMAGRGMLRTIDLEGQRDVEIGYSLAPEYWGRGWGTEIAVTCLERGQNELGLTTMIAITEAGNLGSRRLLEKLGFSFERELEMNGGRQTVYRWGEENNG
jgi:RimJ/RimL family protein N-acetyltransferase